MQTHNISVLRRHRWVSWIGISLLLSSILAAAWGCNSSSSSSESTACLPAGHYAYQLHMSLEDDPATFPDGSELRTYAGETWVEWRNDGHFYFSGGEGDAWAIKGTCDGDTQAFVQITLHNRCANGRQSTATSVMSSHLEGDVLYVINSYRMEWTCGGDPTYLAQERWDLWPMNDPTSTQQPPAQCAGTRVGGYCWYFGAPGESCNAVCAGHGGYHDATRFYAGSVGTDAQCVAVLDALGAPKGADGIRNDDISAAGCCYLDFPEADFQPPDMRVRYLMATTASAQAGQMQRACACQQ
jgi:hypothetical protein